MFHPFPDDRAAAIENAKLYLSQEPVFLDTETTGLTDRDEICEIAIVDWTGRILVNSLVKPAKKTDWAAAAEVHGIRPEMVQDAPKFRDLLPELDQVLRGRTVLVYNASFDEGKLWGSADANGLTNLGKDDFAPWWFPYDTPDGETPRSTWHCAMELYAMFNGDWNEYHHSYTWVRLERAAKQCDIPVLEGTHRALSDARLTREIVQYVSRQEKKVQLSFMPEEDDHE